VDLDVDINQYLAEPNRKIFHPNYTTHSITLRKLLSHSASISVNGELQSTFYQPGDTAFAKETLADMCFKYINPNTTNWLPRPPGNATLYSNEGTSLAALVVERITKMPYDQYVKENILKPLNIDVSKTGVRLADFPNIDELVKHYLYTLNTSFLQLWDQELPQLNIIQLTVNIYYCIFIMKNYLFREIFRIGYIFHILVSVVIQQVFYECQLVLYLSFYECLLTMELHCFLLNLFLKSKQ
jgi:hypothetical protein